MPLITGLCDAEVYEPGPAQAQVVEPTEVTDKVTFCPAQAGFGKAEAVAVPGTPLTVTATELVALPHELPAVTETV